MKIEWMDVKKVPPSSEDRSLGKIDMWANGRRYVDCWYWGNGLWRDEDWSFVPKPSHWMIVPPPDTGHDNPLPSAVANPVANGGKIEGPVANLVPPPFPPKVSVL
jgi:hypothetical protein